MTDAPKSVCVIIPVYQSVNQLAKTVHELILQLISSLEINSDYWERKNFFQPQIILRG
jgi:hypothetical protein